ncbi:hypothetical protein R3P38DRAFT_2757731 [Favolaschia claudopus]|uniref:Uncharacterized protein n=1 Tax=Favolaschia claudopus TaxID=2862362 RepID=A0AAW0E9V8_9AGAR
MSSNYVYNIAPSRFQPGSRSALPAAAPQALTVARKQRVKKRNLGTSAPGNSGIGETGKLTGGMFGRGLIGVWILLASFSQPFPPSYGRRRVAGGCAAPPVGAADVWAMTGRGGSGTSLIAVMSGLGSKISLLLKIFKPCVINLNQLLTYVYLFLLAQFAPTEASTEWLRFVAKTKLLTWQPQSSYDDGPGLGMRSVFLSGMRDGGGVRFRIEPDSLRLAIRMVAALGCWFSAARIRSSSQLDPGHTDRWWWRWTAGRFSVPDFFLLSLA